MSTQYRCSNGRRRADVLRDGAAVGINGIDYLEVSGADQRVLLVHFIHPLPGQPDAVPPAPPAAPLGRLNVAIQGGSRVRNIRVVNAAPGPGARTLAVTVDAAGDYSVYTLRVVRSETDLLPPVGFDLQLSEVPFSFKVDCPSPFDCRTVDDCPPEPRTEPRIDYLAKDYASFRRLILDRLSVTMPDWKERNPADLGIVLAELFAYSADYLSYYQDAAATEAYLGTARRRTSVRRHARLLDYRMHDGCSARTWVWFEVGGQEVLLEKGVQLITRPDSQDDMPVERRLRPQSPAHQAVLAAAPELFETLYPASLYQAHNELHFYTWGDEQCCLPKGATRATLRDDAALRVTLMAGDVLVLEERRSPVTGADADADLTPRHAVRLTRVQPSAQPDPAGNGARVPGALEVDPLTGQAYCEIEWHPLDALPFPFCLSAVLPDGPVADVSIARGNIVLADHGATVQEPADLPLPVTARRYRELSQAEPFAPDAASARPAAEALAQDPRDALPQILLLDPQGFGDWQPQHDLLSSGPFAREFVAEMEEDRVSRLRFGDGILGQEPPEGLTARYRTGLGVSGNIGAEALFYVVTASDGVLSATNRTPAVGGADPEPLTDVRLYAPQAFRTQERAVTDADYAAAAQRHPEVQNAAATLRWTGSWHTMFITVDRLHGLPVDAAFEADLRQFLERFRLAGYDLEIDAPRFVPLDLAFTVCVAAGYFRADVEQALLRLFSSGELPGSGRGLFHPDNLTFGQTVYLSQLIAAAMSVPGVVWVDPIRFQRWGRTPAGELEQGRIDLGRLEIARADNDPNAQENGRVQFLMEGGL